MVKVRDDKPLNEQGQIDLPLWLDRLSKRVSFDRARLQQACELAATVDKVARLKRKPAINPVPAANIIEAGDLDSSFLTGLEMAEILADLQMNTEGLVAAVLYRAVREDKLSLEQVRKTFSKEVATIIEGVLRMAAISRSPVSMKSATDKSFADNAISSDKPVLGQQIDQTQYLRKMLVAMIDDVRVAMIKLAERTCAIRAVKQASDDRRRQVAQEIFDIYAPLAHRLGVGHLKWELEDLSFRYLHPEAYQRIAKLLDGKRIERENYIKNVKAQLQQVLQAANIDAQVDGRVKHIYSIWRKMQKKNVDFFQIYDVRAVRILVTTLAECYAALGLVHGAWKHIPNEFDDYIANPKENGYRSLHTAVLGPDSKVLEVQIRTQQMHEESELGVCAHWHYKEGTRSQSGSPYEDKIAWLRQVLEWQESLNNGNPQELATEIREGVTDERVYVFTPEGHVVDLPVEATPIDFAYHVHTEVGHRCRGAKVNGRIVPLNFQLHTGDQVTILTATSGGPSRDWINSHLGYVRTSRARAKIQHWFKEQDHDRNLVEGRLLIERELQRLRLRATNWHELALKLDFQHENELFTALGSGDIKTSQVLNLLQTVAQPLPTQEWAPIQVVRKTPVASRDALEIDGVDNLMMHLAGCCQPLPGDKVAGYVSAGRGVSVHRIDCAEYVSLQQHYPDRMVPVTWKEQAQLIYPVTIHLYASDRQGLLRDVTTTLANHKVNVIHVKTDSFEANNTARMELTVEVKSLDQLGGLLVKLGQLPSVYEVYRQA